jgi:CubicO group peptidase (beta-lactamase class C family)
MVIVKDGYIVSEYYQENQPDKDYEIYSVTKSITSALIGIAIEQGLIKSIDDKVFDYFPEYADAAAEDGKKEITIENLLTMTSGLDWPEWTSWNYRVDPLIESLVGRELRRGAGLLRDGIRGTIHFRRARIGPRRRIQLRFADGCDDASVCLYADRRCR